MGLREAPAGQIAVETSERGLAKALLDLQFNRPPPMATALGEGMLLAHLHIREGAEEATRTAARMAVRHRPRLEAAAGRQLEMQV